MPYWLMQLLEHGTHVRYMNEVEDGSEGGSGEDSAPDEAPDDDSGDVDVEESPKPTKSNKPSEAEAKLLKETMKRKQRIKELEDELRQTKEQFEGIDPEHVRQLLKEREDAEKAKLEQQGNWNALKEKMAKEHQSEKEQLQEQLKQLQEQVQNSQSVIEKLTVTHQFDSSAFITNELVLTPRKAKAVYGAHFDIDESGRVIGYDKPRGESNRTMLVDGSGDPLPFDEALKRLVDADPDRDELLKAKRRPGAGSATSTAKPTEPKRQLSSFEKIEQGLKNLKK